VRLFAFKDVHVAHDLRELRILSTEFLQYETTLLVRDRPSTGDV
jgi:hypothetical protein